MNEQLGTGEAGDGEVPAFSVVRGQPTDEELAAVWAVLRLHGSGSSSSGPPAGAFTGWSARGRTVRAPLAPGPGAWRASALPR